MRQPHAERGPDASLAVDRIDEDRHGNARVAGEVGVVRQIAASHFSRLLRGRRVGRLAVGKLRLHADVFAGSR